MLLLFSYYLKCVTVLKEKLRPAKRKLTEDQKILIQFILAQFKEYQIMQDFWLEFFCNNFVLNW